MIEDVKLIPKGGMLIDDLDIINIDATHLDGEGRVSIRVICSPGEKTLYINLGLEKALNLVKAINAALKYELDNHNKQP